MWPMAEIRKVQSTDNLYQVECYKDAKYCYVKAHEVCQGNIHVWNTTVTKKKAIWYTDELCGASFERRVQGRLPMDCRSDQQHYIKKNVFPYTQFNMYLTCVKE
jgi:hypothetical protein